MPAASDSSAMDLSDYRRAPPKLSVADLLEEEELPQPPAAPALPLWLRRFAYKVDLRSSLLQLDVLLEA